MLVNADTWLLQVVEGMRLAPVSAGRGSTVEAQAGQGLWSLHHGSTSPPLQGSKEPLQMVHRENGA